MSDSYLPLPEGVPLLWVSPPCRSFSMAAGAPHVYMVQLQTGHGGKARAFGVVFECGLATVSAIRNQMLRSGIVSGHKLLLDDGPDGSRKIVRRLEFAFGAYGLVSIEPYERRLVEGGAA